MKEILVSIAVVFAVIGNIPYLRDVIKNKIQPHPYTWLVWSIVSLVTFFGALGATSPFFMWPGAPVRDYGIGWNLGDRKAFDDNRIALLKQSKPHYVFVCARWDNYQLWSENRFSMHLERLREACPDSQIVFLGQPPELPFGGEGFASKNLQFLKLRNSSNPEFASASEISASEPIWAALARRKIHQRLQQFCAANGHCHFVETESYFLRDGHPYFIEGETLFYWDDDHLSVAGALRVVPAIDEILTRLK